MSLRVGIPLNRFNGKGWIAGFYYIKNCLNAIATQAEKPDVYVFVPHHFSNSILLPEYADCSDWLHIVKIPSDHEGYSTQLQEYIDQYPCDIYFPFNTIPNFNIKSAMIGWIPDFQYKHFPEFFTEQDVIDRDLTAHFILNQSHKVVCSSHNVAQDIEKYYPNAKNKTAVLQFKSVISSSILQTDTNDILKKYDINKKYIFLPNQFWAHKNHKTVFAAWRELTLKSINYQLVCTGEISDYRNVNYFKELHTYLKDNHLLDTIRILGFIDRDEQIQLFRNACAVLQPSLFEGWNTSIEDAKALGKTVIASDIAVHREQCRDNAYYFEKTNASALAELIIQIWDTLPPGHDKETEIKENAIYHAEIKKFGAQLLTIFNEATKTPPLRDEATWKLVLKISSELQVARAILSERQEIIADLKEQADIRMRIIEDQNKVLADNKFIIENPHSLLENFDQDHIKDQKQILEITKNNLNNHIQLTINNHPSIKEPTTHIKNLTHQLQDRYDNVIQHYDQLTKQQRKIILIQNSKLTDTLQKLFKQFDRIKRLKRRLMTPKLGALNLASPTPLHVPKHYYKINNRINWPTISIVTPSFNHGQFIERTIKSIIDQGYHHLEYVIQDGNSKDETLEIIQRYQMSLKNWESKKDQGQSNAINLGFQHTTGEIMAYLNSDDILLPGTLHYIGEFFATHPNIDAVYGHRILINEKDQEIGRWILPPHDSEILSWADYVPQETLFWRRNIWEKAGGKIDESFSFAMDWDLLLRLREAGARFVRLPRFIGAFRIHPNQKTSSIITETGIQEMERLRLRCHGRPVTQKEIDAKTDGYLKRHLLHYRLYQARLLRY